MKIKEILVLILFIVILLVMPNISQAALQSNGGTPARISLENWLLNIRKMEEFGGTLGLNDTINTNDLTSSAEASNNLDIHMEKNTEYGAMAILSASAYGNQNKIANGDTTTGNKTGIVINLLNKEWVSAGSLTNCSRYTKASGKYKNLYTTSYVAKSGDAIKETEGWHNSTSNQWLHYTVNGHQHVENANKGAGLIRGNGTYNSIFSYYSSAPATTGFDKENATRAVIVVGQGF